ncbi:dihydropteroate synthase [uncultured Cocleimonas sp.]|uniref:dihydropteroate synthase n=1 Tax=uncultured Cocleimonas sp. TaxID=1051587 RepID=UPI00263391A1|nr:dihydropteroate synthase [uncultured Cocleimonas sp.]
MSTLTTPQIMGILNVTPDSFSDGGQHYQTEVAVKRAFQMKQEGATIIDIGGESTRPGADPVSADEQIARVIPVIQGIRQQDKDITISVDTTSNTVAEVAIDAGANWINDISAGEDSINADGSEEILRLAANKNVPIVLMHRQGKSKTMQDAPYYDDVCAEVNDYLQERAELALKMGIAKENIILDPGIGFGKLLEHNLALLANLESLVDLAYPILLGTSRKRFIGEIISQESVDKAGKDNPEKRVAGTCATTALGVQAGVLIFRVHDVIENKQALDVAFQIKSKINQ